MLYSLQVNLVCSEKYCESLLRDCKLQLPIGNCLRVTNLGRPNRYISYNRDVVNVPQGFNVYTISLEHSNRDVVVLYRNFICKSLDETTRGKISGLIYSEQLDISTVGYRNVV